MQSDIETAVGFIRNHKYDEAERLLRKHLPLTKPNSVFWNIYGLALRGIARLNDALYAYKNAQKDVMSMDILLKDNNELIPLNVNALSEPWYNLGRLEGECASYHRYEDIRKSKYGKVTMTPPEQCVYTCFEEQKIIDTILSEIEQYKQLCHFCVDIGASDGMTFSNTYKLFQERDWSGLAVEPRSQGFVDLAYNYKDFENVALYNKFITPDNVTQLFQVANVPYNFGFLSLDIDSYDYYVLEEILKSYRPSVICTEINELIPPPIKYALKYNRDAQKMNNILMNSQSGQSLSMLQDLLTKNGYVLLWLEYNNAFAVHSSFENYMKTYKRQTPEEAYKNGLTSKMDWQLKLNWNLDYRKKVYTQESGADKVKLVKELVEHQDPSTYVLET